MIDYILKLSGIIGAITVIISTIITLYKIVKKIDIKFTTFENNQNKCEMDILRLMIINENMPLDERVSAGKRYVERGGNGSVHALYDVLVDKYKNELKEKEI